MRKLLLATALTMAAPLAAQTGTATWAVTFEIPDSLQAMTQGMTVVDLRMIFGTDGQRIVMQAEPGPRMLASSTSTDLSGVRFQAILNATADTLSLGIVLPPSMSEMMGGGIGYRLDLPLDSLTLPSAATDSLEQRIADSTRTRPVDTGERAMVAGVPCEDWRTVDDSTGNAMTMCMGAPPAGLKALSTVLQGHFPRFKRAIDKMDAETRAVFGNRDLIPVRIVMAEGDNQRMKMELLSVTEAAPDPTLFTLPVDLQPFPLAMVQGMMSAAKQQMEQQQQNQDQ